MKKRVSLGVTGGCPGCVVKWSAWVEVFGFIVPKKFVGKGLDFLILAVTYLALSATVESRARWSVFNTIDSVKKGETMSGFESATEFFHTCESAKGWDACSKFVEPNAPFAAQCEPLVNFKTIEEYVNWMTAFCDNIAPGGSYVLHSSSFDEESKTAMFFATYTLRHTGEGGPVPPTNKQTNSQYVYILEMSDEGKVKSMQKVWNAPWAMRELGWA